MLKPAIMYKEELLKLFAEQVYTEDFFLYVGYPYCNELPNIELNDNVFQWAILFNDKVIGYFAYRVNPYEDSVSHFGLYSFDKGNPVVGKSVFDKLEELVVRYHRLEWRMIGGNPVERSYDKFCERHKGVKHLFKDVVKDAEGNYRNEIVYEIVKEGECVNE